MTTQNSNQRLSKKIYIVDCDYLYATSSIPNYKAMKLSSYHQQLGDTVSFITEEYQLTGKHDILYLLREQRSTPFPSGDILDDKRTILMGKAMQLFDDVQELPNAAAVCRPDYSLYSYPDTNLYQRSSLIQFINGKYVIKNMQDWRRSDARAVLVVDETLWDAPARVVSECLDMLKDEHNVIFLHPIKLKKLIEPDVLSSFTKLKLAKFYKLRYNNNIGEDYDLVVKLIDAMQVVKNVYTYLNIPPIPIKIITKDHWESKANIFYDFERCLKIMNYAQKKRVRVNFKYPTIRLASPSWQYFEFFKTWGNHHHTLSYIEALTKNAAKFYRIGYIDVINDDKKWVTAKVKQAVHLLSRYPELMKEYGHTGWSGTYSTAADRINYDYVKEKAIENSIF
jgi:hypothetical protein